MKKLTQKAFQRARSYLFRHGREVDRYLFKYHFENGQRGEVIGAIGSYQNADGGFGQAFEPDLRTQASSAIATQQAFNYLREIQWRRNGGEERCSLSSKDV
jgi:hypothetical protein